MEFEVIHFIVAKNDGYEEVQDFGSPTTSTRVTSKTFQIAIKNKNKKENNFI